MGKRLKRSKYVFLDYLKGDIFAWLTNNTNYVEVAKDSTLLQEASPWRWNQYGLKLGRSKLADLPTQMVDGLDAGKHVREFYHVHYPNLKMIDYEGVFDYFKCFGKCDDVISRTRNLIINEDNFILFEGAIEYKKWVIRPDVIIKQDGKVQYIEVKAITCPIVYHALDVMFQREMAIRGGFDVSNWAFKLTTMERNWYVEGKWEDNLQYLFREWTYFFKSKPSNIDDALAHNKEISLKSFFVDNDYKHYFSAFDDTLRSLEDVQLLDHIPLDQEILPSYNKYMKSDYLPWVLTKMGLKGGSIFEFAGDISFSFNKKAELYNHGIRSIAKKEYSLQDIAPKKFANQLVEFNTSSTMEDKNFADFVNINHRALKRVIQMLYINKDENDVYMDKDALNMHLEAYKQGPVYMYDFETVSQAIPRISGIRPYQQAPYQYSIHVILDPNDFDFKTGRNIVHYQWLASNPKTYYEDFWTNFGRDIFSHGPGVWVSYNKAFERMVMRDFDNYLLRSEKRNPLEIHQANIKQVYDETVDLMEPFKNRDYYSSAFKGSYSIKKVGPHFAPEINYKELDERIQKGDQSAFQAKIWLIEDAQEEWDSVKEPMLEYCKYDTLSMVAILQKLKERVK